MKINLTQKHIDAIQSLNGAINGVKSFQENREHRLKLLAENRKNMAKRRKEKLLD